MNVLPRHKRALVLRCLSDGMGVRATCRAAEVSKPTVLKLLVDAGHVCGDYQDEVLRDLPCRRIQLDEIWGFIHAKEKNAPAVQTAEYAGDIWLWTALCPDTKLMPTWRLGGRSAEVAFDLVVDLSERLAHRIQLTTDGYTAYPDAVEVAFGANVDYAQLIKEFTFRGPKDPSDVKYSRDHGVAHQLKARISGSPDPAHISTSLVERSNLTIRMSMRRYTRLTNAFSRKLENHAAAVALHFMVYNFVHIHGALGVTPAMEAGVTDRLWEVSDIVTLLEEATPPSGPRGPYRKKQP